MLLVEEASLPGLILGKPRLLLPRNGSVLRSDLHPSVENWLQSLVAKALKRSSVEGHAFDEASKLLRDRNLLPHWDQRYPAREVGPHLQRVYELFGQPSEAQVPQSQHISLSGQITISSLQATPYADPSPIISYSPVEFAGDSNYEFSRSASIGHPTKVDIGMKSAILQWPKSNASSTLWVRAPSDRPQLQITFGLASRFLAIVNESFYPVISFCSKLLSKVPVLDFLNVVNRHLASLEKDLTSETMPYRCSTDADSASEELCRRLRFVIETSSSPVIFHNMIWIDDRSRNSQGLVCRIYHTLKESQDGHRLKLLYTTVGGTHDGLKALEMAVALTNVLRLCPGGSCSLSQLQIPPIGLGS